MFLYLFQISLGNIFKDIRLTAAESSSLSLIHEGEKLDASQTVNIAPMEIEAYKVKLS